MSAVLKFPSAPKPESRKTELVFNFRPKPVLTNFEKEETQKLLLAAQRVENGMKSILEFADAHREDAAVMGVETIAIELGSERGAIENALDALEEGVRKGMGVSLSEGSLALIRRMEKLIAEAHSNISRFGGRPALGRPMGQAAAAPDSELLIPALFFFGFALVAVIVIASVWTPPSGK